MNILEDRVWQLSIHNNSVNSDFFKLGLDCAILATFDFGTIQTKLKETRYRRRVCQAWHLTSQVKVLIPGIRRAEG